MNKKKIKLKPYQVSTEGVPEARRQVSAKGYAAPAPSAEEFEQIAESIHKHQHRPEQIEREYHQDKSIYKEAERLGKEEKHYSYHRVISKAPRDNSVTGNTLHILKQRKSIPMDEVTGFSLLTDAQKSLSKNEREKVQKDLVNKRGWGNPWGNFRPLMARGLARYDRKARLLIYTGD